MATREIRQMGLRLEGGLTVSGVDMATQVTTSEGFRVGQSHWFPREAFTAQEQLWLDNVAATMAQYMADNVPVAP